MRTNKEQVLQIAQGFYEQMTARDFVGKQVNLTDKEGTYQSFTRAIARIWEDYLFVFTQRDGFLVKHLGELLFFYQLKEEEIETLKERTDTGRCFHCLRAFLTEELLCEKLTNYLFCPYCWDKR